MKLDVGSGHRKLKGFVGIDKIKFHDTDIQHDITVFPWPIDDDACSEINVRYVWGCIDPKLRIDFMNELWRIIALDSILTIQEQHNKGFAVQQDPLYYSGADEFTWTYFDRAYNRYNVYKPKPWHIEVAYMREKPALNISVKMRKVV